MNARSFFSLGLVIAALGCGSPGPSGDPPPDPRRTPLPCRTGDCGDPAFRAAVPSRGIVRIDFGPGSSTSALTAGEVGGSRAALEDPSQFYLETLDHVTELNDVMDAVLESIEYAAGGAPDEETEAEHVWREEDPEAPGIDIVLDIETTDGGTYALAYYEGPTGFEPLAEDALVHGTVTVADEIMVGLDLTLDLDALTAVDPSVGATGEIVLLAQPIADGLMEVWYDFHGVDFGDGEGIEESRTTYWVFAADDHALEYVADLDGVEATAFVRWNDADGRWDHHTAYEDVELGLIEEIATSCWVGEGSEVFAGSATFEGDGSYSAELDGDEASCAFGPVDGHPSPTEEFDDLPGEGEWDDLVAGAEEEEECDPEIEECL